MVTMNFKIDEESHKIIKGKAKKARMSLKDYFIECAVAANVETIVKITFDGGEAT